jgi:hypothetical protein
MDSLKDLLGRKADQIDLQAKRDELGLIQEILDRHWPDQARALKIYRHNLSVKVRSSAMASELRLGQLTLIEEINRLPDLKIERLIIRQ